MQIQIAEFTIRRRRDVGWSGQRARLLGSLAGLPPARRSNFGKAVETIVSSIVDRKETGSIRFDFDAGDVQRVAAVLRIQGQFSDGEDPREISETLSKFVDSCVVDESEAGSTVRLTQSLPVGESPISPETASEWATPLATRNERGALSSSQRRIGELATNLRAAQQKGLNLERELENLRSLTETLELLALVASKTDNAVVILDSRQCVEWVNEGFVRMTGFEIAGVRGQPLRTVLYGEDQESAAVQELDKAFSSGHGVSQEILHQRQDGRTYWATIGITPVFNDEGKISRWIAVASDTTRRRRAQEALRQAKDEAETASRAKSEFLANMSHEIRTPMNAIIGMAELALDTHLDSEQQDYLTTILDSAESLLQLLNDILDLSKIEARKLQIETVEFSLAETLRDALKPFMYQAQQQGVHLELDLPLTIPERLIGDPNRLRQILANLVGNAVKFTNEGAIVVAVREGECAPGRIGLRFSVQDSGIGIPADELDQIFVAFSQADSSTSRRFGGTGLGLAISSQLVSLMGGNIGVESEEGVGSRFHFELLFGDAAAGPETSASPMHASVASPDDLDESARRSIRALTILVADDNRANRTLAAKMLEKRGHHVAVASSGREVLERLRSETFDIVLMDVQMPELDGLQTTAHIRQQGSELACQPYIIALTAHAMQGDRERCLAAGMDAYIAKPLRAKQLMAAIDAVAVSREDADVSPDLIADPTAWTFAAALDRLEGDTELLLEQMGYYLEDSPILIRDIATSIEGGDSKRLQMAAHRLRGLSAGFDATVLVDHAARLEEIAGHGTTETADVILPALVGEWERLVAALRTFVANDREQDAPKTS